jgi:hypothetical protein
MPSKAPTLSETASLAGLVSRFRASITVNELDELKVETPGIHPNFFALKICTGNRQVYPRLWWKNAINSNTCCGPAAGQRTKCV